MTNKLNTAVGAIALVLSLLTLDVAAQTTAFTYQGRLTDGGSPANGSYDLEFKLFNLSSGGAQQGTTQTLSAVTVTSGIFTVQLDFGSNVFTTNTGKFLEIGVRNAGVGGFTTLPQRQPVNATPYAVQSISATSATNFSGNLNGDVTGTQSATVVSNVGGQSAANVASGASAANAATSANTPNTIVKRDASGNFSAGTITAALNGNASTATSATTATTAGNVTGTVAIANGGTGATSATNARTNLGLGSLATVTPTGTASTTTFLRGDNSWAAVSGGGQALLATLGADLTVSTSNPTYADAVSVNLEANKTYFIHGMVLGMRVGATSGQGTVRMFYSGNATTLTSLAGTIFSPGVTFANSAAYDQEAAGVGSTWSSTITNRFEFRGYFQTTSAGTLKFQVARASTNTTVDLLVSDGSFILAIPVN